MTLTGHIRIRILHHDPIASVGLSVALGRYPDFVLVEPGDAAPRASPGIAGPEPADIAVTDYAHGIALVRDAHRPGCRRASRIVIVADAAREWQIKSALENGVQGYLLLSTPVEEIANAVRSVHRGGRHVGSQIAARLAESLSVESLTAREEEVLRLVVEGLCNKAIGRRLGIALGTVKSHLKSTFDKLNVTSRTQAVIVVERRGLLGVPSACAALAMQTSPAEPPFDGPHARSVSVAGVHA